jgi:hypothetical protein
MNKKEKNKKRIITQVTVLTSLLLVTLMITMAISANNQEGRVMLSPGNSGAEANVVPLLLLFFGGIIVIALIGFGYYFLMSFLLR